MMNILNKLKQKPLWNNFHIFAVLSLLTIYSIRYKVVVILLIIYIIYLFKQNFLIKELLFFMTICFILSLIRLNNESSLTGKNVDIEVTVSDIEYKDEYIKVIYKYKKEYLVAYYDEYDFLPGDVLEIEGTIEEPKSKSYHNDFDYKKYLNDKNIYNIIKDTKETYLYSKFNINKYRYKVYQKLETRLGEDTLNFVKPLCLGLDSEVIYEQLNNLDLSYILAVSGMHILLIYSMILKIILKVTNDYELSENIALFVVISFTLFIGYPISAQRSIFFLGFQIINKRKNLLLTKLDIWSITVICFLFYNPKNAFDIGFILSFLVTFTYILFSNIYIKYKGFKASIIQSMLAFIVTFPIIINLNGSYNLLGILFSFFFITSYSYFILPLSFFCVFFPNKWYESIFNKVIQVQGLFTKYNIDLTLIKFNTVTMIIYYIIIYVLLKCIVNKKKIVKISLGYLAYIIVLSKVLVFIPCGEVTFIDVGQGDSIYIRLPNNKANILIDTFNDNINYLKTLGINKIDYLFITHSDIDHMENVDKLVKDFNVDTIVGSIYDIDFQNHKCHKYVNNSIFVKKEDNININGYQFHILSPCTNSSDLNGNSIVINVKLGNYNYLFTGDIGIIEEEQIIKNYPNLKIDVLKVAHHGSKTSSSQEFINHINPKYSIISVGENKYGLPNEEIISRLTKTSTVYSTIKNGNISFIWYNEKTKVKIYKND